MPLAISLDMADGVNPATLQVTLNGTDITGSFSIFDPPEGRTLAELVDFWDPAVVLEGENALAVSVNVSGVPLTRDRVFHTEGDPYADVVDDFVAGSGAGYGQQSWVLGAPRGAGVFQGSLDVLSLGLGGVVVLEFVDNVAVDGPGVDFTVFENSFLGVSAGLLSEPPFSEPGRVAVSQDGSSWTSFGCDLDPGQAPYHAGCAGVYPVLSDDGDPATPHASIPTETPIQDLVGLDVIEFPYPDGSGGDSFDLADLGLGWIRFVRIEAAGFVDGPTGPDNAGFDLDAVAAVNSAPATDANGNGIPDAVE
jgi:hypothetical protein